MKLYNKDLISLPTDCAESLDHVEWEIKRDSTVLNTNSFGGSRVIDMMWLHLGLWLVTNGIEHTLYDKRELPFAIRPGVYDFGDRL